MAERNPAAEHARARLRMALDRQSRADTSEAWLADQAVIEAETAILAGMGVDAIAERAAIERQLSGIPDDQF